MSEMNIELCPETGICSLVKGGTDKADLMPFEVDDLKAAANDPAKAREIIKNASSAFEEKLTDEELAKILESMK
jgi:hypothetical protein